MSIDKEYNAFVYLIAIIFGVLLIVLVIIAIYVTRKSAVYEKQIYRLKTTIVIMQKYSKDKFCNIIILLKKRTVNDFYNLLCLGFAEELWKLLVAYISKQFAYFIRTSLLTYTFFTR